RVNPGVVELAVNRVEVPLGTVIEVATLRIEGRLVIIIEAARHLMRLTSDRIEENDGTLAILLILRICQPAAIRGPAHAEPVEFTMVVPELLIHHRHLFGLPIHEMDLHCRIDE